MSNTTVGLAAARRLYEVWVEAREHAGDRERDRVRKAGLRAGLRKRTVEILVTLNEREQAS